MSTEHTGTWLELLALLGSLLLLAVGAELLVRGAASLARSLGVSSFFVGLTIVGFGTSTPELLTSLLAAFGGRGDIAVGNVVGSNIFNIAMILGLTALLRPIPVRTHLVRSEVIIVIGVAIAPLAALATGGVITRGQGLGMVALLGVYLWRGYRIGRMEAPLTEAAEVAAVPVKTWRSTFLNLGMILVGLLLLIGGSHLLIWSATGLARQLGLSELVIGLTIIAGGTSAPELVTSLVAALRRQSDMSVGNILGSNIFNILGILGLTAAVWPQTVAPQVLWLDTPVMLAASVALLPIMLSKARISRTEGAALLAGYATYVIVLIVLGAPPLSGER